MPIHDKVNQLEYLCA